MNKQFLDLTTKATHRRSLEKSVASIIKLLGYTEKETKQNHVLKPTEYALYHFAEQKGIAEPSVDDIEKIGQHVKDAISFGVKGFSSEYGLMYSDSVYQFFINLNEITRINILGAKDISIEEYLEEQEIIKKRREQEEKKAEFISEQKAYLRGLFRIDTEYVSPFSKSKVDPISNPDYISDKEFEENNKLTEEQAQKLFKKFKINKYEGIEINNVIYYHKNVLSQIPDSAISKLQSANEDFKHEEIIIETDIIIPEQNGEVATKIKVSDIPPGYLSAEEVASKTKIPYPVATKLYSAHFSEEDFIFKGRTRYLSPEHLITLLSYLPIKAELDELLIHLDNSRINNKQTDVENQEGHTSIETILEERESKANKIKADSAGTKQVIIPKHYLSVEKAAQITGSSYQSITRLYATLFDKDDFLKSGRKRYISPQLALELIPSLPENAALEQLVELLIDAGLDEELIEEQIKAREEKVYVEPGSLNYKDFADMISMNYVAAGKIIRDNVPETEIQPYKKSKFISLKGLDGLRSHISEENAKKVTKYLKNWNYPPSEAVHIEPEQKKDDEYLITFLSEKTSIPQEVLIAYSNKVGKQKEGDNQIKISMDKLQMMFQIAPDPIYKQNIFEFIKKEMEY